MSTVPRRLCSSLDLFSLDQFHRLMSEPTRYERFGVVLVDAAGIEMGGAWLSQDCQDRTTFRLRDLARVALHHDAAGMILVHSHPHSATPKPSKLDIETTRIVHEYFLRIGIPVLDHRIYGTGGQAVFSFVRQQLPWSVTQLTNHLALELE